MPKHITLTVKKSTRPAEITDLVPGDSIYQDGKGGEIVDVRGKTEKGILYWSIEYMSPDANTPGASIGNFGFMYKLCKV